jgi:hypothetical protein
VDSDVRAAPIGLALGHPHRRLTVCACDREPESTGAFANPAGAGEFLAIDMWDSPEGLQKLMSDPSFQTELGSMSDGAPDVTVWTTRDRWRTF